VIEVDSDGRIIGFHEKVQRSRRAWPGNPDMCLASMGNYVFNTKALMKELDIDATLETSKHDFGHDILPHMVQKGQSVYAYDFATNESPAKRAGPRLLARHRDARGVLAGADGPHRDPSALQLV